MVDNKIFKPEDFDKQYEVKNKHKKQIVWSIVICAIVLVVVSIMYSISSKDEVLIQPLNHHQVSSKAPDINNETVACSDEPSKPITVELSPHENIEQLALDVIRGQYGNNPERRNNLGDKYIVVQRKVNEMYRDGLVY